jgi:hypothetical protein
VTNLAPTRAGREKAALAMASENPTEFLGKRLTIGGEDLTDLVEACVVSCERAEEDQETYEPGTPRPALVLELTLGGKVTGLTGKDVELWRLVDGEPHIAFTGEATDSDPKREQTTVSCSSPGVWNAEIDFEARTSFPGTPASAAAYSVARRNARYRGARFKRVSQPFSRRGSEDFQANQKLAEALEEIREESGLCVLDGPDAYAEGWLPPPPNSPGTPAVWYEIGEDVDEDTFSAPARREGSYRAAVAYADDGRGEILEVARRRMERRPDAVWPPPGVNHHVDLGDEDAQTSVPRSTVANQRVASAVRVYSARQRDVTFTAVSDPRYQRGDVVGLIHRTSERGRGVVRRLAVPVDSYSDDCVANEKTYTGFGTVLSEVWEAAARVEPDSFSPGVVAGVG